MYCNGFGGGEHGRNSCPCDPTVVPCYAMMPTAQRTREDTIVKSLCSSKQHRSFIPTQDAAPHENQQSLLNATCTRTKRACIA